MKTVYSRFLFAAILIGISCTHWVCNNPFFPETGTPLDNADLRTTPGGVIEQLQLAYEARQLDMFLSLLDSSEFRFYIPLSIETELTRLDGNKKETVTDSVFLPAGNDIYIYLTYAEERRIHKNLFNSATEISFISPPIILSQAVLTDTFMYTDTIYESAPCSLSAGCEDSLVEVIRDVYDTLEVAVLSSSSRLHVEAPGRISGGGEDFDFGLQVFFMKKYNKLWYIQRWYELDY